jgi:hypothetical protein
MTNKHGQWYIRKQGEITGPFNGSVIMNHLIVGRLSMDDEVSADSKQWLPLAQHPGLHPDTMSEDKAKRHLDERTGLDRRQQQTPRAEHLRQRRGERRSTEPESEQERRDFRRQLMLRYRDRSERMFWPLLITFGFLIAITLMAILFPTTIPMPLPNCSSPAAPEVNWNNCLKSQADLSNLDMRAAHLRNSHLSDARLMNTFLADADMAYANLRHADLSYSDLSGAILFGTNLTQADLSNADLSNADLAYADLTNAKLGGVQLDGARLDSAIWIDGQVCAANSIGECLLATQ